jgi:predicted RNA binding protein YcfA (HicA-like mRNA interferase family)
MNKKQKLYESIKDNPQNTKFCDLTKLASHVGFVLGRTKGGHHQYIRPDDPKILISFQPDKQNKSMAKGYQVKQLINFIEENNLQSVLEDSV